MELVEISQKERRHLATCEEGIKTSVTSELGIPEEHLSVRLRSLWSPEPSPMDRDGLSTRYSRQVPRDPELPAVCTAAGYAT